MSWIAKGWLTLKLLAITPLATLLWFGVLGGVVWRLEPDLYGRDGYGSQVGNWIHRSNRLTYGGSGCFVDFNVPISGCIDSLGQKHIMCEGSAQLGLSRLDWTPPLIEQVNRYAKGSFLVSLDEERDRGVLAHTQRAWKVTGFDSSLTNPYMPAPEYLELMEANGLQEFAVAIRNASNAPNAASQFIRRGEITRPIWSGYFYNGVMAVLLVVGLHSMRWVYRGVPLRQLRQVWRPAGECEACGYSLLGLNAAKCPECGAETTGAERGPSVC